TGGHNWIMDSANIAAHELGHMQGMRHADAYGPIGFGIHNPPGAAAYVPSYPGPEAAFETNQHIITSPATTGTTVFDEVTDLYFGEREAVRLAMAYYAPTTPADGTLLVNEQSQSVPHADAAHAQALSLVALNVPNTLHAGAMDYGKQFAVGAVDVLG